MILDRVTITGADDSIDPHELYGLSQKYTFVEWGILLSESKIDNPDKWSPRYPSANWQRQFAAIACDRKLHVAAHICGRWVRELCAGCCRVLDEAPAIPIVAQRIQLNFHSQPHAIHPKVFRGHLQMLSKEYREWQFIFQFDDVNNELMQIARAAGIDAVPLFDRSGGAGVLPKGWPAALHDIYCGYAGGLAPDNLQGQLNRIERAAGRENIWIDCETHVRSNHDSQFDLAKVEAFLKIAEAFVTIKTA